MTAMDLHTDGLIDVSLKLKSLLRRSPGLNIEEIAKHMDLSEERRGYLGVVVRRMEGSRTIIVRKGQHYVLGSSTRMRARRRKQEHEEQARTDHHRQQQQHCAAK